MTTVCDRMTNQWFRKKDGRPFVMGILNVTPDSFSDGGRFLSKEEAIKHAFELEDAGADIIDIGGESTRPGSHAVPLKVEMERVIPVIRELSSSACVPISVDTSKHEVAKAAIEAGACMLNDICGLSDPKMIGVAVDHDVPVVIMHMHGTPETLGTDTMSGNVLEQVKYYLNERIEAVLDAGIRRENIVVDPGIGFGKTPQQDMEILRNPRYFTEEYPVLIGPSRKRFLSTGFPGLDREEATAEASIVTSKAGADIIRVHDVAKIMNALNSVR